MLLGMLLSPLKQIAASALGAQEPKKKRQDEPAPPASSFEMSPELAEEPGYQPMMPAGNNWSGASLDQLGAPLAAAYGMQGNRYDHSAQSVRLEDKYMSMFTPGPDARQM